MCFVVVDPLLLVRAYEFPRSAPAQLLALFIYGRTCAAVRGLRIDELEGVEDDPRRLAALREWAERDRELACRRRERIEDVFEQLPPDDLLLVASKPLRAELIEAARRTQGAGRPHVQPDRVNRHIVLSTVKDMGELGRIPPYLDPDRVYRREYLIHTAVRARAHSLVTEDERLRLWGDATHSHPTTRHSVRPYSLPGFVQDRLPSGFDFNAIDAPAVFRAAAR